MKGKGGDIEAILWQRRYILELVRTYPKAFEVAESATKDKDKIQKVKALFMHPLAMHEALDSADRDLTFAQSLPNEPLRLLFKHVHDVMQGFYSPEIKGALNYSATWSMTTFHEGTRVKKRFFDNFTLAYDSLGTTKVQIEEEDNQVKEQGKREEQNAEKATGKEKGKKVDKSVLLQ